MNFHFRVNSNKTVGIGHLIRNLKLAKRVEKEGNNCFFYLDKNFKYLNLLKNFKFFFLYKKKENFKSQIDDANKFLKKIKIKKGYVVVDDSRLCLLWEKKISKKNFKIIAFEDLENKKHFSDFYINGKPKFYNINNFNSKTILKKNCKILVGPKFSIIECKKKKKKYKKKILKILFYMGGGGDFKNLYNIINNLLKENDNIKKKFKIIVVIGPFLINKKLIYSLSYKYRKIQIIRNKYNIDNIIKEADLVVGTAGNIIYETAYYKIPSLFFQISENQINDAQIMEKLGHYFILSKKDMLQSEKVSSLIILMINHYSRIIKFFTKPEIKIDNKGLDRLVNSIKNGKQDNKKFYYNKNKFNSKNYKIEKVKDKNINDYLKARNLLQNVKSSTKKKKISPLDHYIWWLNSKRRTYVLKRNGKKLLYFYDELIDLDGINYSIQGWFISTTECTIKDVFYALSWQKKHLSNKKNIDKSLAIFKKKNKLGKYISKYLGWKPIIKDKKLIADVKGIYKVDDSYLFYFR